MTGMVSVKFNKSILNQNTECYEERQLFFNHLKRFVAASAENKSVTIVLHGSYATGEITPYSDIDLLAFYPFSLDKRRRKEILRLLSRITFYIHRRDPLMHHAVDVIDQNSLGFYDESALPIDTLKKSVLLFGSSEMSFSPDEVAARKGAKEKLLKTCEAIMCLKNSPVNRSQYKLKCLVSMVLLVPVLLLQADGRDFRDKKESLSIARLEYGAQFSFEAIERATYIRELWQVPRMTKLIRSALIPFESHSYSPLWLQRLSGALPANGDFDVGDFLECTKIFAEEVLSYAKNNII